MAELADARDSKSRGIHFSCGFDPHLQYHYQFKNLPPALLTEVERAASAEHITLDEVLRQAVERYIEDRRWQIIYQFGEQQACKLGIREGDVLRQLYSETVQQR